MSKIIIKKKRFLYQDLLDKKFTHASTYEGRQISSISMSNRKDTEFVLDVKLVFGVINAWYEYDIYGNSKSGKLEERIVPFIYIDPHKLTYIKEYKINKRFLFKRLATDNKFLNYIIACAKKYFNAK